MDGSPDLKDVRARGGNPCLEQTLESYELCCLVLFSLTANLHLLLTPCVAGRNVSGETRIEGGFSPDA